LRHAVTETEVPLGGAERLAYLRHQISLLKAEYDDIEHKENMAKLASHGGRVQLVPLSGKNYEVLLDGKRVGNLIWHIGDTDLRVVGKLARKGEVEEKYYYLFRPSFGSPFPHKDWLNDINEFREWLIPLIKENFLPSDWSKSGTILDVIQPHPEYWDKHIAVQFAKPEWRDGKDGTFRIESYIDRLLEITSSAAAGAYEVPLGSHHLLRKKKFKKLKTKARNVQ